MKSEVMKTTTRIINLLVFRFFVKSVDLVPDHRSEKQLVHCDGLDSVLILNQILLSKVKFHFLTYYWPSPLKKKLFSQE